VGLLSAAIIAGMWWSYDVLGWGGYWAWDPVENAFVPPVAHGGRPFSTRRWCRSAEVCCAFGISIWVVGTFVLTILGTFLTRSGIISSVHAFHHRHDRILFPGVHRVGAARRPRDGRGNSERLKTTGRLDSAASRETIFLLNNLFLTAFMLTVLVGTLFPLVAEAVRGVKVSVGSPFFDRMSLPMIAALLFLMGVGPALPWKIASKEETARETASSGDWRSDSFCDRARDGCPQFLRPARIRVVGYSAQANLASSGSAREPAERRTVRIGRSQLSGWWRAIADGTAGTSRISVCSSSRSGSRHRRRCGRIMRRRSNLVRRW